LFNYGYDAESRLVSVSQGGTMVASYAYDAD
jgi:YD repeat-containing protein